MDYLDLSTEFLNDIKNVYGYNSDIPLQYRIVAALNSKHDYCNAKNFIDTNKEYFQNEYMYLLLDSAIEMCLNVVVDENGMLCDDKINMSKDQIYKPTPDTLEYIEYLLQNGANPYQPEYFDQFEHVEDLENDSFQQVGVRFDCSEIKKLFEKYC